MVFPTPGGADDGDPAGGAVRLPALLDAEAGGDPARGRDRAGGRPRTAPRGGATSRTRASAAATREAGALELQHEVGRLVVERRHRRTGSGAIRSRPRAVRRGADPDRLHRPGAAAVRRRRPRRARWRRRAAASSGCSSIRRGSATARRGPSAPRRTSRAAAPRGSRRPARRPARAARPRWRSPSAGGAWRSDARPPARRPASPPVGSDSAASTSMPVLAKKPPTPPVRIGRCLRMTAPDPSSSRICGTISARLRPAYVFILMRRSLRRRARRCRRRRRACSEESRCTREQACGAWRARSARAGAGAPSDCRRRRRGARAAAAASTSSRMARTISLGAAGVEPEVRAVAGLDDGVAELRLELRLEHDRRRGCRTGRSRPASAGGRAPGGSTRSSSAGSFVRRPRSPSVSRIVTRSRIETPSPSSSWSTRCTSPTRADVGHELVDDGREALLAGGRAACACPGGEISSEACWRIGLGEVRDDDRRRGRRRCSRPPRPARGRAAAIHSAGSPNAGSTVGSPGSDGSASPGFIASRQPAASWPRATSDALDLDGVLVRGELDVVADADRLQHEAELGRHLACARARRASAARRPRSRRRAGSGRSRSRARACRG